MGSVALRTAFQKRMLIENQRRVFNDNALEATIPTYYKNSRYASLRAYRLRAHITIAVVDCEIIEKVFCGIWIYMSFCGNLHEAILTIRKEDGSATRYPSLLMN